MRHTTWCAFALVASLAGASPAAAQQRPATTAREFSASGGFSRETRGVDADGWHATLALAYRPAGRLAARLEATTHRFGAVPLYPCLIQDSERCYQTLDRKLIAATANATYDAMNVRRLWPFDMLYVVAGVGVYGSRRTATAYPDCDLSGQCRDRDLHRTTLRDTQLGFNGGIGMRSVVGTPLFIELRAHYTRANNAANSPSNDYWLVPISFGIKL